ncbi:MAG: phosphomannomutase [Gammaproteobacteria bacterium]|nr:MAG: phosphomannomutase [Gammaproteobacteria bacterium]
MASLNIMDLMSDSGVGFGTSGARGLVVKMTDQVCYAYTRAFLQYLQTSAQKITAVAIAGDLRSSTPRIMAAVSQAARDMGIEPINCGHAPSPTVALFGMEQEIPAIMVTGSHIPDDRNGIKFNTALGEITKTDEQGIREQVIEYPENLFDGDGQFIQTVSLPAEDRRAIEHYKKRYTDFFASNALDGQRVGLYQHSGVARDLLNELLTSLGAEVIELSRSDTFIPVDTEAIRPEDEALAVAWAKQHDLHAIVSTDGDADRPLISDENGQWMRGDAVGALCGHFLGAEHVVTPVSSNTAIDISGWFDSVLRTRIGSPFVIEGMEQLTASGKEKVVGYEANGGFLIQDPIERNGKTLAPLPTRDAVIVIIGLLAHSKEQGIAMSKVVDQLPERYTYSDRIKEIPQEKSASLLAGFDQGDVAIDRQRIEAFFDGVFGNVDEINRTDGLRIRFDSGLIVHIRPSGNAPELRCYTEDDNYDEAVSSNQKALEFIRQAIT